MVHTPRGRSGATFVRVLAQSECGQFCHFGICGPNSDCHHAKWHGDPWVGPHAPSFGRQLWGLPSRVEYLSPQGVLLPLVYGTTASLLWFELWGHSAWQVTPSWTVYRLACHRLLPWLRVTFAMVPDAAWPGSDQWPWSTAPATGPVGRLGRPSASDPWGIGSSRAKGMGVSVGLPVDRVWNGGSDLQAGVEIYYWEHPRVLAHFEQPK